MSGTPSGAQHEHVTEWTHLLRLDQPAHDPVAARIRVHAVLSVAHDTARTAHLHRNQAVPAVVVAICTRLLGLRNTSSSVRTALSGTGPTLGKRRVSG
jgi:hypothetical protein